MVSGPGERPLVFHSPFPVERDRVTGSRVRPQAMLRAFEALGVPIWRCDGPSPERARVWREILASERGMLGVYSELSTVPIALADPDRLPRHPFMDFSRFRQARQRGWPVAAYYRDIHWRFPFYRERLPWWQHAVTVPFYHLEWARLHRSIDHLFLPSAEMFEHFPAGFSRGRVSGLPPGVTIRDGSRSVEPVRGTVRVLYVGGIRPPIYDLRTTLRDLAGMEGIRLTVCCREDEWAAYGADYGFGNGFRLCHAHGDSLAELYAGADVFCFVTEPFVYHDFAMPVKLFEAMGYGVPPIVRAGTAAGRFVTERDIGWAVSSQAELRQLLAALRDHPGGISEKRANLLQERQHHTWEARARTVLATLERYRGKGGAA